MRSIPEGSVVVDPNGVIMWVGRRRDLPAEFRTLPNQDYADRWILPGFVDAHVHFPQYRMLASHGQDLLDWLNRFTFPEELAFESRDVAQLAASKFLGHLANAGTTCCLCFATTHVESVDAIFHAALSRNMALITGKTLMDRGAPLGLLERSPEYMNDCRRLIDKWHGKPRLRYAISPRFAVTSTEMQLEQCGELAREYPELGIQTHLSESLAEIEVVKNLFPWARHYTDVYDRFGLVGNRSIFAHGIHLSQQEKIRISQCGGAIIHCPTSNTFLGSGLFPWKRNQAEFGLKVGIGSDIGAGTTYSMLQTMKEAYSISQILGNRLEVVELFGAATIGNAHYLGFGNQIGTIESGKFADLIVVNPIATELLRDRAPLSKDLTDQLFLILMLGDDRVVEETLIAGQRQKSRQGGAIG